MKTTPFSSWMNSSLGCSVYFFPLNGPPAASTRLTLNVCGRLAWVFVTMIRLARAETPDPAGERTSVVAAPESAVHWFFGESTFGAPVAVSHVA
jgi:hypothetical protein